MRALDRVEDMVGGGVVPAPVQSRVRRVAQTVRETMPRLRNLGLGSPDAYSVMATATDYLPEAIGAYTRLPRQWADSRPIENGKTSLMLLIDQLDLLSATMDKIFDAVVRVDADALDRAWPLPAGEVRSCLNRRSAEHRRSARAGGTAQHLGPAVTEPSTRTLAAPWTSFAAQPPQPAWNLRRRYARARRWPQPSPSRQSRPIATGATRPATRTRRPSSMPHTVADAGAPLPRRYSDSWS